MIAITSVHNMIKRVMQYSGWLLSARKVWGKVIFSVACQEFCSQGGVASVHAGIPPPEQTPPRADTPLGTGIPCAVYAGRYSQQVGGMHPTGMQSCLN